MKRAFILKNKDYFLLFLGNLVSNLGTHIFNFSMSLYILFLTGGNAIQAGLYMAFGAVVFFVLTPFGGAIVDRLDKVKVVFITDLINGAAILIAGYAIFSGLSVQGVILVLYATSLVLGVNGALFSPAARSLPVHILEEDQLQQSSSLTQGVGALYAIIGPAIGGVLYGFLDIEFIFWINGISFILSGFSEMFIKIRTKEENVQHKITLRNTLVDIKEGFSYLWTLKGIRNMMLIAAILNFFTAPIIVNGLPYLFTVELDVNPMYYSMLLASYPVGIIVSSILLGSRKQKERVSPLMVKGLFGMSFSFSVFAVTTYLLLNQSITFMLFMIIALIAIVITGFFNGFLNVPLGVAIMKSVEKDKMGRVFSVTSIISNGVTPIAIAIGGVAITYLGMNNLFLIACVALFITSFMTLKNKAVSKI